MHVVGAVLSGVVACRDSLVGDAQALVAPKMAPWAGAAGRYQEESAADLEGGDFPHRQDHFAQPPPPPPRKPAPKEDKKKTLQVRPPSPWYLLGTRVLNAGITANLTMKGRSLSPCWCLYSIRGAFACYVLQQAEHDIWFCSSSTFCQVFPRI